MNEMEDYKEKIKDILGLRSFSAEDMAFWDEFLDMMDKESRGLEIYFEILQLEPLSPEVIRFITDNGKKLLAAAKAKDKAAFRQLEKEQDEYFENRLQIQIKQRSEVRDLYCRQKAAEQLKNPN